jgi:hypothetical protein
MPASVVLERSEVAFVDSVGPAVVGYEEVDLGVVYVEDSKARVQVVISLKTYMQTTLVPTNSSRLVGYEWMVFLDLLPDLLLSTVVAGTEVDLMQSPANR